MDINDITKIAHLARLALTQEEAQAMHTSLNDFFEIVQKMQAVDTTGIVPLSHPTDAAPPEVLAPSVLRLREDVVQEVNDRTHNQRNAPLVERGLFLVPKVIE